MFRHVLVPLDGSPLAARILYYVEAWFAPKETILELVRVVPPYQHSLAATDTLTPVAVAHTYEDAQTYLHQVAGELRAKGYTVNTHLLEGDPSRAIKQVADEQNVDLIAMTTHGRTGLARVLLGSVAESLVSHAYQPLLLVRALAESEQHARPARILVPLDGSDLAERELPFAQEIAKQFDARILLLEVVEHHHDRELDILVHAESQEAIEHRSLNVAQLYLERISKEIEEAGITTEIELKLGKPADEIVKVAAEEHIDLIVMSTHGYGGMTRLLLGSVTREVLRRVSCPLMVIPPKVAFRTE